MNYVLVGVLMSFAPGVVAWSWASETPEPCQEKAAVVFVGENGEPIQVGGDAQWVSADGEGKKVIVVKAGDGASAGGTAQRQMKVVARVHGEDEADAAQRGWLGVSIGNVSDPLRAQLDLKDQGILVLNVVDESPADAAGLEANDILLSINGHPVASEVGGAVDLIKSFTPGAVLNVVVLRNGQQMTRTVTLGSRADMKDMNIEWKFEGAPDAEMEEHIKTRGKFIMRDPSGNWITKDLGDLGQLKGLPQGVRMFVPESGSKSVQVFVENGKKTIKARVENDGTNVAIEQIDDGEITVRRTDAAGAETVATYADAEALRAGDAEASELYDSVADSMSIQIDGAGGAHAFVFKSDDGTTIDVDGGEWQEKLEESLAEAKAAYQSAMEELHSAMQQGMGGVDGFDVGKLHGMLKGLHGPGGHGFSFQVGKPKHTFEARADGTIEVRIRKGDSELVQLFNNAADLAARNPELSKKYQELLSAGDE